MTYSEVNTQLSSLINGLLYISESENPLELLPWNAGNMNDLLQQIATYTKVAESQLQKVAPDSFFGAIQKMADPADEVIMAYANRYRELRTFLEHNLKDLQVIKAGNVQVHVFIVGFTNEEGKAVVLHTIAVET